MTYAVVGTNKCFSINLELRKYQISLTCATPRDIISSCDKCCGSFWARGTGVCMLGVTVGPQGAGYAVSLRVWKVHPPRAF